MRVQERELMKGNREGNNHLGTSSVEILSSQLSMVILARLRLMVTSARVRVKSSHTPLCDKYCSAASRVSLAA